MALISLQDVSIAFGGPQLLDGATLQIERNERVCLVGRNGAGKSTLMKIVSGELAADSGIIAKEQGLRIAALSQEVPHDLTGTVFEAVSAGLGNLVELLSEYHTLSIRLANESSDSLINELESVQHKIEAAGGWQLQQKVDLVLTRLMLNPDADVSELSGGYKRRVLLARALVNEPDLLLLDEPTNHLDIASIDWLEEALKEYSGALLFITHDRRFLKVLATRIVELDRGRLTDWPGDYETYLKRRQAELDAEATHNALFDKKLAKEEAWIRQGIKARRTRNEGRVAALKQMRAERQARREQTGSSNMYLNEARRSGKLVLEAEGISCAFGEHILIKDFSTIIMRGDKIGIIGPNGSGKTTLLKMLLGTMEPQTGSVRHGVNLEVAYFDQHRMQLDDNRSVMENVAPGTEHVTVNGRTRHIISYLEDFLFPPERARMPVRTLSGGERNRALLAKLFTNPSNVLVMDEPTNDLDIDTLELLEDMLVEYEGTVLLVSHDREFLNNVVTSTMAFEGSGRLVEYVGGYDDWLRQRSPAAVAIQDRAVKTEKPRTKRERPRTLSFKEKKELAELPEIIEALEAEREAIYQKLASPDFYKEAENSLPEAKARIEALDKEIPAAYERWDMLEAIAKASE